MKQKKITFKNDRGFELAALLDLPEDESPLAFALFAHCFTCTKNISAAAHISRALSRLRIAVLRFDFTGLGDSEGDFTDSTFSQNVRDLVTAARFLEEHYRAPRILIGHSLGGAAVLRAAADIPSAEVVSTIAAPARPDHLLGLFAGVRGSVEKTGSARLEIAGRVYTIGRAFVEDLEAHQDKASLDRLGAALLVMHSPRDRVVAVDNASDIYRAARHPKSFISLDPADHLLSRRQDAQFAAEMIAAWSRRHLQMAAEETTSGASPPDNRTTARTGRDGPRTDLSVNGHALVADEPSSQGGTGRGPSPYDYLLAALGSCTGMTLRMYAERKKWPLEEAVIRLRHEKIHAEDCAHCESKNGRIDRFERELELLGDLNDEQRQRLLEIAEKCPVHKTLHSEVTIETRLKEKDW